MSENIERQLLERIADLKAEREMLRAALRRWVSMARADVRYHEHQPEPRGHHPYDAPLKASLELFALQERREMAGIAREYDLERVPAGHQ